MSMLVRHHNKRGTAKSENFEVYAESKLEKLERLPFNVSKVDVCTSKEGAFYTVEICALGKREIRASASTDDLMESLDRAVDKVIAQVTKLKLATRGSRRERRRGKRDLKHEMMKNAGFVGDIKKVA
ncbi:MAG: HPF/RaiA family ribosome-associated protein [Bdellovibrionales bacterium]